MSQAILAAKGVVSRTIGGETVLVPVDSSVANFQNLFLLNKVAAFVWKHLDGTRSRDQLCAMLREQYVVADGADLAADVDRFLSALLERGLVRPA